MKKTNTLDSEATQSNGIFSLLLIALQVYCDFHGHSRKKNVFMYGCSTAATTAANSSSSGEADSGDLVDSVRERVAELSGSDSTSSMDPSDIDEDPGYRVKLTYFFFVVHLFSFVMHSFSFVKLKLSYSLLSL